VPELFFDLHAGPFSDQELFMLELVEWDNFLVCKRMVRRHRPAQSPCVVEDNPDGVAHAGADAAHPMAEIHAVIALRTLHRPIVDSEGHGISLPKRHDLDATLHARPLFVQGELAACEVRAGFREEDCDLDRKREIAVQILVEAIEVARDILQQQRCRTRLAGIVALLQE
jgi:hypothetical protein